MPSQATYDDANLILKLYELRREEKLREARAWFFANFKPATAEEMMQIAPMGSQESTNVRMVVSYWDMACSFVTSGVLNQDLFMQSNGECLVVWERIRFILPAFRAFTRNPKSWHNLETVGTAYVKHMESNGPEAYAGFQALVGSVAAAAAAGKS